MSDERLSGHHLHDWAARLPLASDTGASQELAVMREELTVAEEELRASNEELMRTVDALHIERSRYRDLFVHAAVPYMVTDAHSTIREANRAMSDLLNRRADHLTGKPCVVFVHDVSRRRVRTVLRRLAAGTHRAKFRVALNTGRTGIIPVEVTVVRASSAQSEAELRWILTDLRPWYRQAHRRRKQAKVLDALVAERTAEVAELIAAQAAERGLMVEVERVSSTVVVRADQERLRQILVNLLGNAIKFTNPGGLVRFRATLAGDAALIEVEDTGVGIPSSEHESIFRPFTRLRSSANTPGTGLGLAISRDMARAMGGDLTVTSTVGEGSCFTLRLPFSSRTKE